MTDAAKTAERGYESIRPAALDRARRYKLFTGSVIPRPIALVTSLGETGVVNAAPFSQFVIVAVDPGLLGFSIGPGPRGQKDTLRNVVREREFVHRSHPAVVAGHAHETRWTNTM